MRVQRGFGAGSGMQTARAGAGSKLRLNLGHWDSPEQRQAEAQVYCRGGTRVGWREEEEEGGVMIRAGKYQLTHKWIAVTNPMHCSYEKIRMTVGIKIRIFYFGIWEREL